MSRRFGCELEFSSSRQQVQSILEKTLKNKLQPPTNLQNYKRWQVKRDNSTSGEVISPICTKDKIDQIMSICNVLDENDIEITENDGFHVHVSIKKKEIIKVLALWLICEKDIFKAFPKHRRDNMYCKKLLRLKKEDSAPVLFLKKSMKRAYDHYAVISTFRDDINTVEFRIAEGTLNANFVRAWINFCVSFVDFASKIDPLFFLEDPYHLTMGKVISMIKLNKRDAKILMCRRRKFGKQK